MLSFIDRVAYSIGQAAISVVDLELVRTVNGAILYGTTRYGGTMAAWRIDKNEVKLIGSVQHQRPDGAGAIAGIAVLDLSDGKAVLTGGGTGGALALRPLGNDGSLGANISLGTTGIGGDLENTISVSLGANETVVFGAISGMSGIGRLHISGDGKVLSSSRVDHSEPMAVIASVAFLSGNILYGVTESGSLTSWRIDVNGDLTRAFVIGPDDGLWIADSSVLVSAVVDGVRYLVVAASGSSSISTVRISSDGQMRVADHIRDDLNSRFDSVSALEVVEFGDATFVIAGGADDGISVWRLLPGGRLLSIVHLDDGMVGGLSNINAISSVVIGDGIDIFVAGQEGGLVRLRFVPPSGQLLFDGGRPTGGSGADILMDGAGVTVMTGGMGADVFVMIADGVEDTITDFQLGIDRIDLSAWGLIYSLDALNISATATGMVIRYGREVLHVHARGGSIDPAKLNYRDLIDGTRSPIMMPDLPPPIDRPGGFDGSAANDTLRGTNSDDVIYGQGGADHLYGGGGADRIFGGTGHDFLDGGGGNDTIFGGDGDDVLIGGSGQDSMDGGAGNDSIYGGVGNDWMHGGPGNDLLEGGDGADELRGGQGSDTLHGNQMDDRLWGMDGDDFLFGGVGNDELFGGNGNDYLVGDLGNDTLHGEWGNDLIFGGSGNDLIYAGMGDDTVWMGAGNDHVIGGAGHDLIYGEDGNDFMSGGEGHDWLYGGNGNDWFQGGPGNDTIYGGNGNDTIIGGAWRDVLYGGAGADVFMFRAYYDSYPGASRDVIMDFVVGLDRIHLAHLNNDQFKGGDAPLKFVGNAIFSGNAAEVRTVAEQGGQLIAIDLDGDGRGDLQIFLQGASPLGADDFIL